ncbi:uncharacterized protein RSE6_04111 [Rhynchosporium secalis]|uniref:Uncharacterized protein n=1 Tax=Rhynchosporium secalis TaxID=38038 RepID=A0A1E1M4F5_RHYSE|nr:uncharacterized protein RSE6_04111 [Rhynchosporium secalis]
MRLINTKTLQIESFPCFDRPEIPHYAILSHRWGADEIFLQEMQSPSASLTSKLGYLKVLKCCELAASFGFEHVWIDTCCIDKSNSSELAETINSMFHYYRDAEVCYAYLSDVPSNEDPSMIPSKFRQSSWFTRGWTLQELLAPKSVIFYGDDWKEIGMKSSLEQVIASITLIAPRALENFEKYKHKFSIAQKMAWASARKTERLEDMAYCLMGLFGVNMPMIYGEGRNAFRRLQLELLKETNDQSIFAWKRAAGHTLAGYGQRRGLLASSPIYFNDAHNIVRRISKFQSKYSMTNVGLEITLPFLTSQLSWVPKNSVSGAFLAVIQCSTVENAKDDFWLNTHDNGFLGIHLNLLSDGVYERIFTQALEVVDAKQVTESAIERTVYVTQTVIAPISQLIPSQYIHVFQRRAFPQLDHYGLTPKTERLVNWTLGNEDVKLRIGADITTSNKGTVLLFTYDAAKSACGIYVGLGHQGFYYNIVPDVTLQDIESSKGVWRTRTPDMKAHCDRTCITLKGGRMLNFAVRPGYVDGMRARLVEVSAEGDLRLESIVAGLGILRQLVGLFPLTNDTSRAESTGLTNNGSGQMIRPCHSLVQIDASNYAQLLRDRYSTEANRTFQPPGNHQLTPFHLPQDEHQNMRSIAERSLAICCID